MYEPLKPPQTSHPILTLVVFWLILFSAAYTALWAWF